MVDYNEVELQVGDKILVAFNEGGNVKLEYAVLTCVEPYTMKVRLITNRHTNTKTKTLRYYNSKCMKQDG